VERDGFDVIALLQTNTSHQSTHPSLSDLHIKCGRTEKLGHNRLNERARIEAALKATDEEEARAASGTVAPVLISAWIV
jgi:hypothetical protein